jgi:hypothetical protein
VAPPPAAFCSFKGYCLLYSWMPDCKGCVPILAQIPRRKIFLYVREWPQTIFNHRPQSKSKNGYGYASGPSAVYHTLSLAPTLFHVSKFTVPSSGNYRQVSCTKSKNCISSSDLTLLPLIFSIAFQACIYSYWSLDSPCSMFLHGFI